MSKHVNKSPVSNGLYDILKRAAELGLPAAGTLYFAVAQIWGLPNADKVVGTIVAVNAFIGVVVVILNVKYDSPEGYFDGSVTVQVAHQEGESNQFVLHMTDGLEAIEGKQQINLKVNNLQ